MDPPNLDILIHPMFRCKSEELVLLLNKAGKDKVDIDKINVLAKSWLVLYTEAKKFVYEPPFVYCNMYMMAMRRSCERGGITKELLVDAYNLWITALDSFQKGYKAEET